MIMPFDIWTNTPVRRLIINNVDRVTRKYGLELLATGSASLVGLASSNDMPELVHIIRHDKSCVAWFEASESDVDAIINAPSNESEFMDARILL
jgi:hypothetical protein